MDPSLSLTGAMATEPLGIRVWLGVLVFTHLGALLFVVGRSAGRWQVRVEPIAILVSFFAAATLMNWLYAQTGYTRLLGLAHLVFWTPVWVWILRRRRPAIDTGTLFGKYVRVYLVVAGTSLDRCVRPGEISRRRTRRDPAPLELTRLSLVCRGESPRRRARSGCARRAWCRRAPGASSPWRDSRTASARSPCWGAPTRRARRRATPSA